VNPPIRRWASSTLRLVRFCRGRWPKLAGDDVRAFARGAPFDIVPDANRLGPSRRPATVRARVKPPPSRCPKSTVYAPVAGIISVTMIELCRRRFTRSPDRNEPGCLRPPIGEPGAAVKPP